MSQDSQNQRSLSFKVDFLSSVPIEHMELSRRAKNALIRGGLKTALDIQRHIEENALSSINNVGPSTVTEIKSSVELLLKNKGLDLKIGEIGLFLDDKAKVLIPSKFYNDLPIEILAEELGPELVSRLKSARFEKMGELLDLSITITTFIQDTSNSLAPLIKHQKNILQQALAVGKLHPKAQYRNMSIERWLKLAPENPDEQLELLDLLAQANETDSLTKELSILFDRISERDFEIYIKYFNDNLTLEQIGKQQGITRERVRQITSRVASKVWNQANQRPSLYLQSALLNAKSMGPQLSLKAWKSLLQKKQVIESYVIRENFDSFDTFCALLQSNSKSKYPPNWEIEESIIFIINSSNDLSLGVIQAIEEMPSKAKRKIQRRISYMGGIHLAEASDILNVAPQKAIYILRHLNYSEIIADWYTIASANITSRWPVLKAGLAMMEACGPLEFNLFCDGIRRYISRFYDIIAPPKVMKAHLEVLGFEFEDGYVCWHETPNGYLAESDECFIKATDRFGPVVNFQEIVEFYQEQGFSIATATARVLPQSPIVEKVDFGLYKIRGQNHSWEDVEDAKSRQETIDYDPEVTYGIDGIIRYRITIGSWALNGVVSISLSQQPLPDLGEGWPVMIEDDHFGTARRDEYLIWGLGSAFNALGIQIGDRVELAFDAWEKPKIKIAKL